MTMSEELVKKIPIESWSKWARQNFLEFTISQKSKYLMTKEQLKILKECIKEKPYDYVKYVKLQFKDKNQETKQEFLIDVYQLNYKIATIAAKNYNELLTVESLHEMNGIELNEDLGCVLSKV